MTHAISASDVRDLADSRPGAFDRILEWIVLAILVTTVVIYLGAFGLAFSWTQRPFLGAFVEKTFVFNGVGNRQAEAWTTLRVVPDGRRLIAIDGVAVSDAGALSAELARRQVGDPVTLATLSPAGQQENYTVQLTSFPLEDFARLFVVPFIIGLVYLGIGMWVFRLRRGEYAGRAFALTCALAAIAVGGIFDIYTTHVFTWAWTLAVANIGAGTISLGLVFPQAAGFVRQRPILRLVSFVPGLGLAAYALYTLYVPGVEAHAYVLAWRLEYYYLGFGLAFLLGMTLYRWLSNTSPIVREQSRVIFLSSAVAFAPLLYWVAQSLLSGATAPFNAAVYLAPILLFPAGVAYAILRYRLLETDVLVGRALVYAGISVVAVAGYALLLVGLSLIAGTIVNANDPIVIGLMVIILVAAFNPLREQMQRLVDLTFFRGSRSYTQRLEQFGRALTRAAGVSDIVRALRDPVEEVLRPAHFHLFLRDSVNGEYAAFPGSDGRHTTDIRFALDGPLASMLATERLTVMLSPDEPLPARLMRERARLALLGSALFVPLASKSGLSGWMAVGPKLSGDPFGSNDIRFLDALADQAALAIERAAVISDLERRVTDLNVITQISQAVSYTVAFDDLLELVYAQAGKIVDTRNFYVSLKDKRGAARYAFFIENDERLNDEENKPLPVDRGLENDILRTGQPIRADDYMEECHRRNLIPGGKLFRAWMGVPLNAGSDTIGVMVVAATDPTVIFTEDQLKVFWTIADQAASAITKARLFQQAEQRAQQLATLNAISLSISSTLELDPLLQRIVESAANIIGCEAGSLFLIDSETGEYVFRVATGPVGQNLLGMRIAPGKGFVGEAIETGRPVIVNDVQTDPRWFKGTDQSTGFVTHALITVPMLFRNQPIGAIQLINKKDGSPFGEDDQSLLTAFASPAAISIENARLFTQTDQALAARVDELSVMQRVDRELNATLDIRQVMGLTVDWAMKHTGATAGFAGVVREVGLLIVATQGYGNVLDGQPLDGAALPLEGGYIGRVLNTNQSYISHDVTAEPDYVRLLDSTRSQMTLPIKRERQVIGIIHLESDRAEAFNAEQVAFAERLVEHASIAVTNSQLFDEVRAANEAKSTLMSFVAHELKTPMTPIRGYADLLLGGAVGSVNDMQRQFLSTIRNNIDRMKTIVEDLNDSARIEAGKLRLDIRTLDFQGVIEEVLRTTKPALDNKKQTLAVEAASPLPTVLADHGRAVQVFTNLVSNAYKYTPEGGHIVVRARPAANTWDPDGAPEVLHISVQDNGIGIAPEDQKKLFQKFFRAEDRMAREMAPGTGLGLNIVKNLVELQGGRIWMESEFRKGSTFHFTLPLAPAAEAEAA
jgi:signal transduction histidine kinase